MIRFKKVSVWLSVVLICMMLGGYLVATVARSDNKEEKESVALSDAKAGFASEEDVGSSHQTQQGSTDIDGYFRVTTIDGEDVELWHEKFSGSKTLLRIGGQYYPLELDIGSSNYGSVELLSDDYDDDGSKEYAIFTSSLDSGCGSLYVIEIDGDQIKVAEFGVSDLYEQIKDADDMKLISAERCFVYWCYIRTPTRDFFENGSFQVNAVLRTEESGKGKLLTKTSHT